ncbi:MAG: phage portal protein [Christensenellales bacterium]
MNLREYFTKELGYALPPEEFYGHIAGWDNWYRGDVASFHRYRVYNGVSHVPMKRATLNMAKKVCEDWANMLMNERLHINISDETTRDFVIGVLDDNNWWVRGNEAQELKAALGTVAYIPYVEGAEFDAESGTASGGKIRIDSVAADCIYPLSWSRGEITECAFVSRQGRGKEKYYYAQLFTLDDEGYYELRNVLLAHEKGAIKEAPLSALREFAHLPERVALGSKRRPFIIDRLNIANNISRGCPLGVSIFANAIDALKGIDLVYDSYNNEFILGKKRIMANYQALKMGGKEQLIFDTNDTVFYQLPDDISSESFIKEIDMKLRSEEHEKALQNRLMLLSAKCGLGNSYYRLEPSQAVTATQVISENSELYKTLRKHEILLREAIVSLSRRIIELGIGVLGLSLDSDCLISVDFDDSIVEDKAQIKQQAQTEYRMGLIDEAEYFSRAYNMPEQMAVEHVRKMKERKREQAG